MLLRHSYIYGGVRAALSPLLCSVLKRKLTCWLTRFRLPLPSPPSPPSRFSRSPTGPTYGRERCISVGRSSSSPAGFEVGSRTGVRTAENLLMAESLPAGILMIYQLQRKTDNIQVCHTSLVTCRTSHIDSFLPLRCSGSATTAARSGRSRPPSTVPSPAHPPPSLPVCPVLHSHPVRS
jgi:hypothetical protein